MVDEATQPNQLRERAREIANLLQAICPLSSSILACSVYILLTNLRVELSDLCSLLTHSGMCQYTVAIMVASWTFISDTADNMLKLWLNKAFFFSTFALHNEHDALHVQ